MGRRCANRTFRRRHLVDGQSGEHHPRRYMLYEPASRGHAPAPLLVLLHGCKQGAADFAAGTRMNEAAEAAGVVVLYPEQSLAANLLRCWNWYALHDRSNKDGDAAVIAAMTRQVMREHDIDATRVYVAGMSAGGGMAAVLVRDYPELYAALGVHSGVPAGLAHDVYSAMRLMSDRTGSSEAEAAPGAVDGVGANAASIVFHGDEDTVVHLSNGVAIHEAQAVRGFLLPRYAAVDHAARAGTSRIHPIGRVRSRRRDGARAVDRSRCRTRLGRRQQRATGHGFQWSGRIARDVAVLPAASTQCLGRAPWKLHQ